MSTLQAHPPAANQPAPPRPASATPPLENGDHLTRAQFMRRYEAMPHVKKAELIEGMVHMPSPVRYEKHGSPHSVLGWLLTSYAMRTPGLPRPADNVTLRLDQDNILQPDLFLFLPQHAGGRAVVDEDDYVAGPPDLVCEISASTVSIDLHRKLNVYRRGGVREYLVWRTQDAAVDWFSLREGAYVPLAPSTDGLLRSEVFPGMWLDPAALLRGDLPRLFEVVDLGTRTPEHDEFVRRLAPPA